MHTGLNATKAILFNIISSFFSVLGCVIGLAMGEYFDATTKYLLPVAAGQFLYVSLVQLLPELLGMKARLQRIYGTVGCLVGVGLIGCLVNLFHE